MAQQKENQEYMRNCVNPLFEKIIVDLLAKKPRDVVSFVQEWLRINGDKFRQDTGREDSEGSDQEQDDYIDEQQLEQKRKEGQKQRNSVSAEAYGMWNKKSDFKARVIPKTDAQKKKIRERLEQAFMFSALDEQETETVILAMEEKKYSPGEWVINQGEDGDNLYVVDQGTLKCFKRFSKGEEPKLVKTYQPGESFGELALLYNAPRAASIQAEAKCVLFALDRETFNHIVKDSAVRKREQYENFLKGVEILDQMDPYERTKLGDALKECRYKKGDYVVREGETGNTFFLVVEGQATATKSMKQGSSAENVYDYHPGDYFGELALLKNIPRQANIVAKTDLLLVSLDRQSFKRLLGPLENILQRNFKRYEKYM